MRTKHTVSVQFLRSALAEYRRISSSLDNFVKEKHRDTIRDCQRIDSYIPVYQRIRKSVKNLAIVSVS